MANVLITGSGSGLGLAAALAFAGRGDTVYATVRDEASTALREAARRPQLDLRIAALDVTLPATFPEALARIVADCGSLDVLVNNAGIIRPGALEDLAEADLRAVMETNFFGPLLLTRAALPHLRRQGCGLVIMISSLSGLAGLAGDVIYSASKFALEGATEALRHEVDRWGIRVALVEAGGYATRLFRPGAEPPPGSPYRALTEYRVRRQTGDADAALPPSAVAELLLRIAHSREDRLRWAADATAQRVLDKLHAGDDAARDRFLRDAGGCDWWSEGRDTP